MPNYDFRCTVCGTEYHDIQLPIARRNEPVENAGCTECPGADENNPETWGKLEPIMRCPMISSNGGVTLPSSWGERLAKIKERHPRNNIQTSARIKREL